MALSKKDGEVVQTIVILCALYGCKSIWEPEYLLASDPKLRSDICASITNAVNAGYLVRESPEDKCVVITPSAKHRYGDFSLPERFKPCISKVSSQMG